MGDTYKVKYCFDKQFKTSLKLINIIQNSAFNLLFPNVIYFTTNTSNHSVPLHISRHYLNWCSFWALSKRWAFCFKSKLSELIICSLLQHVLLRNTFASHSQTQNSSIPVGIHLLKVNNRNTKTRCEICSKLTIKTPERRQASFWCLYS